MLGTKESRPDECDKCGTCQVLSVFIEYGDAKEWKRVANLLAVAVFDNNVGVFEEDLDDGSNHLSFCGPSASNLLHVIYPLLVELNGHCAITTHTNMEMDEDYENVQ